MDSLKLIGVEIYGYHGTIKAERELGRRFRVDVELYADMKKAGTTDDLRHALDYRAAYRAIEEVAGREKFRLIESVAEGIAERLLETFMPVERVVVRVKKLGAPVGGVIDYAEVEIERVREL